METILQVKGLTVTRDEHKLIDDLSFDVNRGETLAVIGPNGAGKTTLFRALLGLIPFRGEINWKNNFKIGYVPQKLYIDYDLPVTTYEFFSYKEKNKQKIIEALDAVGLREDEHIKSINKHILGNKLANLSGGELQRVLIAWALLGGTQVLLFDEPTSGVDIVGEETIYAMLENVKKKNDLTIILISHELDIVRKFTSKVLCLNKQKVCFGEPHEVMHKELMDELFGEEVKYYKHQHDK